MMNLLDQNILNIAIPVSRAECQKEGCVAKDGGNLVNLMATLQKAQTKAKRPFSSMTRKNVTLQSTDPIEQITRDKNFLNFYQNRRKGATQSIGSAALRDAIQSPQADSIITYQSGVYR